MAFAILQGDSNDVGGTALIALGTVLINNKPVCQAGAAVSLHPGYDPKSPHAGFTLNPSGYPQVLVGNRPIAVTGLPDTCGHSRSISSGLTVRIGPG